jgi:phosphoserine phosphatase
VVGRSPFRRWWAIGVAVAVAACTALGISVSAATASAAGARAQEAGRIIAPYHLGNFGWRPELRRELERLIRVGRGSRNIVVFDWDDTTIARSIGEATFEQLILDGQLSVGTLPVGISPTFVHDGQPATPETLGLNGYHRALNDATLHEEDPESNFTAAAWLTQVMAGKQIQEVLDATARAYAKNRGARDMGRRTVSMVGGAPRPFLWPGMVRLYARLLQHGYRVFVVASSNVWSVRYMVRRLNRAIQRRFGRHLGVPLRNVIGASVLIRDRFSGRLYKDRLLVRSQTELGRAYANLDPTTMRRFELTQDMDYPVSDYWGKVANILQSVSADPPYLVAGDAAGDLPMLTRARYRLWIGRLEDPRTQRQVVPEINSTAEETWLVQPALATRRPGFVPNDTALRRRLRGTPPEYRATVHEGLDVLERAATLDGFFTDR